MLNHSDLRPETLLLSDMVLQRNITLLCRLTTAGTAVPVVIVKQIPWDHEVQHHVIAICDLPLASPLTLLVGSW